MPILSVLYPIKIRLITNYNSAHSAYFMVAKTANQAGVLSRPHILIIFPSDIYSPFYVNKVTQNLKKPNFKRKILSLKNIV